MSNFKAGRFTFTTEQIIKFGAKFYNLDEKKDKAKMNEMNGTIALNHLLKENHIGSLQGIIIPKGIDVPGAIKRDGFYRGYFLVIFFKPLSDEETIEKFELIPFDLTDADMKRILELLTKYDCKEQEMEGHWKTFSKWSFVEHIEPKVDV